MKKSINIIDHSANTEDSINMCIKMGYNPGATHTVILIDDREHPKRDLINILESKKESFTIKRFEASEGRRMHKGRDNHETYYQHNLEVCLPGYKTLAEAGYPINHFYSFEKEKKTSHYVQAMELGTEKIEVGANLKITIYSEDVHHIHTLEEILSMTKKKGEVIHFKPTNETSGIPDCRKYEVHMKVRGN